MGSNCFLGLERTVIVATMSHWKWRETKQQPSSARLDHRISWCSVSLHFLRDILATITVEILRLESSNHKSVLGLIVTGVGRLPTHSPRSSLTRWKYTHVIKRAANADAAASHVKTLHWTNVK